MDAPTAAGGPFFEWTAKILGMAATLLLILSVVYDYSFLLALGLKFDEVPTTLSDHVRSAIIWLPPLVVGVAVGVTYHLFLKRIEGGRSEEELVQTSPTPRFTAAFRKSADILAFVTVTVISASILLFGTNLSGFYPVSALFWWVTANSIIAHPRMGSGFTPTTALAFIYAPVLAILVGWAGYFAGEKLLRAKEPGWEITVALLQGHRDMQISGMRRFEASVIVVAMDRVVHVLPADAVKYARESGREIRKTMNMCEWFGWACPDGRDKMSPPKKP